MQQGQQGNCSGHHLMHLFILSVKHQMRHEKYKTSQHPEQDNMRFYTSGSGYT
ncbi:hypothetical protein [Pontibacter flavimaris]|uniref:hypothetical protein n=1 Tax=Pontibacter flavimaris TaxID=1797110 RepID=UPI00147FD515|nr:hypothetical protein [Pontibacter flavimaris]